MAEGIREEFRNVREEYWREEVRKFGRKYGKSDRERMKDGKPPIGKDGYGEELHHKVNIKDGGTNDRSNLERMTRTDHRLGENYRKNHPK